MKSQLASLPEYIRLCRFFKAYYERTRVIECVLYEFVTIRKCRRCKRRRY